MKGTDMEQLRNIETKAGCDEPGFSECCCDKCLCCVKCKSKCLCPTKPSCESFLIKWHCQCVYKIIC